MPRRTRDHGQAILGEVNVLFARPSVYTDSADEVPELMSLLRRTPDIDVVILDLPRGMQSPKRIAYLETILKRLVDRDFEVAYRTQKRGPGNFPEMQRKRTVVVGVAPGLEITWGRDLAHTLALMSGIR
jgi:hypothetical protein